MSMEKEEILEVLQVHLDEMNKPGGKDVSVRFIELRLVVNLLAKLVLLQENNNK